MRARESEILAKMKNRKEFTLEISRLGWVRLREEVQIKMDFSSLELVAQVWHCNWISVGATILTRFAIVALSDYFCKLKISPFQRRASLLDVTMQLKRKGPKGRQVPRCMPRAAVQCGAISHSHRETGAAPSLAQCRFLLYVSR